MDNLNNRKCIAYTIGETTFQVGVTVSNFGIMENGITNIEYVLPINGRDYIQTLHSDGTLTRIFNVDEVTFGKVAGVS